MKVIFAILFIILFFQGCSYTVYQPVPPTSFEGKQCVKVCEREEYQCKKKELEYINRCEMKNRGIEIAFDNCMEHNQRIKDQISNYCLNSPNKSQCMQDQTHVYQQLNQFRMCRVPDKFSSCDSVDLGCEERYERCFLNCGGSYFAQVKELF